MFIFLDAALWLSASAGLAFAYPDGAGIPKLMGRSGPVDIGDLADRNVLMRRDEGPGGSCGGIYTCRTTINKCCSQHGWCGDTGAHCGEGCQPEFGICSLPGEGKCGAQGNGASCGSSQCCSNEGYCGSTKDDCMAPYCQEGFGRCDSDYVPPGGSTADVPRPKLGNIPYGSDIYDCRVAGDIALTFDDGPDIYTSGMLDVLASHSAKATFFITGINNGKGAIDATPAWSAAIKKMAAAGHQLASHTWSHADLSTLSEAKRRAEMFKLEMAMRNVVGYFPTYMRPPYSSCNAACMATMKELGYHITYFDLDTDDYNNVTPGLIQNAKNNFAGAVNPSNPARDSWLTIAHDIHQQTAQNLTEYMLTTLGARGYRAVTVGQCLGDPSENWYRTPGEVVVVPGDGGDGDDGEDGGDGGAECGTVAVADWCAPVLPSFQTIARCWDVVGECWDAGDACYESVPAEDQPGCATYHEGCAQREEHCLECIEKVGSEAGPCTG